MSGTQNPTIREEVEAYYLKPSVYFLVLFGLGGGFVTRKGPLLDEVCRVFTNFTVHNSQDPSMFTMPMLVLYEGLIASSNKE